jgi:MerR family transcriptional regulator, light-induced transcriptional regulator
MENQQRNPNMPVYNIKAVARLIGLLPVTLRAWERRYGLPLPHRGDQGYRLYSEYDVRTLRWVKTQMDSGLSISRAVNYLTELRSKGKDPAIEQSETSVPPSVSTQSLAGQFRRALEIFNDVAAAEVLRRAFSIYSVDSVLMDIVQPTMVELGEAWHRGDLSITVEHFATQFCMQHLNSMMASAASPTREGIIIAACAPGEVHQIGLLSLVVMLRWRGLDVKYLGPDLKLDRMAEALAPLRPKILLFTATLQSTAENLMKLNELLEQFPNPKPLVILGGQAFDHFRLPESIPVIYLNASPTITATAIEKLMLEPGIKI